MPTTLPVEKFPPRKFGNYPNMARRDAVIWERFLDTFGADFAAFSYNVALGGQEPTGGDLTDEERQGWKYVTSVKIDAVGWKPDETWVIEVKPNAGLSAIGQALGYTLLGERDGLTDLPIIPVVVTDNSSPDVIYVAQQLGVDVIILPEPTPGGSP